ncbi:MAG: Rieske (2Fe-2S) protein [Rhodospirillales bacterium]|jgi:nitrite reductase/ring-hydroxylating ferredoxin subunit
MKRQRLCSLSDIPDGDSAGFTIDGDDGYPRDLIAVRKEQAVYVYDNNCPHIGAPLDFVPGQFLDAAKEYIFCSNHAALFRIEDGHCVWGPCAGEDLEPLVVDIKGDDVFITPK